MEPVTMVALGSAALGAGGAAAGYFGAKSEAKRKNRAIKRYRGRMDGINSRLLEVLATQGRLEQEGTIQGITRGGAESSAAGEQAVADRSAQIDARLAALSGDAPPVGTGAPAATQAAMERAGGRYALGREADQRLRVLSEQDRSRDQATVEGALPGRAQVAATRTGQSRAQIDAQAAEADLQGVMGSTGNTAMNLQLLGALAGVGSQAGFAWAGRA